MPGCCGKRRAYARALRADHFLGLAGAHPDGGQRNRHVRHVHHAVGRKVFELRGRAGQLERERAAPGRCGVCHVLQRSQCEGHCVGSAIEGDRDGAVDVAEHQAALVVDDLGVDGAVVPRPE